MSESEILHRSTVKDLELERAELAHVVTSEPKSSILPDLLSTLSQVLERVSSPEPFDPEVAFRRGLEAMDIIDAKRFVMDNMLEGLKRGEQPAALLARFARLGLVPRSPPASQSPSDADVAEEVGKGRGMLKRWGLAVAQILVNAVRAIPKFVEIEPSISLVGPIPVLSFAIKGSAMTAHELFEALRAPGRFSQFASRRT